MSGVRLCAVTVSITDTRVYWAAFACSRHCCYACHTGVVCRQSVNICQNRGHVSAMCHVLCAMCNMHYIYCVLSLDMQHVFVYLIIVDRVPCCWCCYTQTSVNKVIFNALISTQKRYSKVTKLALVNYIYICVAILVLYLSRTHAHARYKDKERVKNEIKKLKTEKRDKEKKRKKVFYWYLFIFFILMYTESVILLVITYNLFQS